MLDSPRGCWALFAALERSSGTFGPPRRRSAVVRTPIRKAPPVRRGPPPSGGERLRLADRRPFAQPPHDLLSKRSLSPGARWAARRTSSSIPHQRAGCVTSGSAKPSRKVAAIPRLLALALMPRVATLAPNGRCDGVHSNEQAEDREAADEKQPRSGEQPACHAASLERACDKDAIGGQGLSGPGAKDPLWNAASSKARTRCWSAPLLNPC
jgi:hypothetical protein